MALRLWQLFKTNMGSMLLSFFLALAVWISAVVVDDPNERRTYPEPIKLEIVEPSTGVILSGEVPDEVTVELSAPSSLWGQLTGQPGLIQASVDLSTLGPGKYVLPVELEILIGPVRLVEVIPSEIAFALETEIRKSMVITPVVSGEPAIGFHSGELSMELDNITIAGPQSNIDLVVEVIANIDVEDARNPIDSEVALLPVDNNGQVVSGITLEPEVVNINLPITQSERYRDVSVTLEIIGAPGQGYRLTTLSVTPPTVTIFLSDPNLVSALPGVVQTDPLDLTGSAVDIETRLALNIPDGVTVVGDQNVLVNVGISAIETSISRAIEVEIIGLEEGFEAEYSPDQADVILSGPLLILNQLAADDVRLFVDLTSLGEGSHLVELQVDILSDQIGAESITPAIIEVTIASIQSPDS